MQWVGAYVLAAGLGLQAAAHVSPLTPLIWPPAAIALLGFFVGRTRAWPGLLLGVAVFQWLSMNAEGMTRWNAELWTMGQSASELVGPALAAFLLLRCDFSPALDRRRDLMLLLALGVLLGPLLSTVTASLWPLLHAARQAFSWQAFALHWGQQSMAVLMFSPGLLLIAHAASPRERRTPRSNEGWQRVLRQQWVAGSTLLVAMAGAGALFFTPTDAAIAMASSGLSAITSLFALQLLLGCAALGAPRRLLLAAIVLIQGLALWGSQLGLGPFATVQAAPLQDWTEILPLWGFITSLSAIAGFSSVVQSSLRRHNKETAQILQHAELAQAVWQFNARGAHLIYASPMWKAYLGLDEGRGYAYSEWQEAMHPLDKDQVRRSMAALLDAHGPGHCEENLRLLVPGKGWRWFELRVLVLDRQRQGLRRGKVRRIHCTLADADWRHTAEERQRLSIALYAHLQEGLIVTDLEHRVLDVNPAYCQMMAAPRDALIGHSAQPLAEQTLRQAGYDPVRLDQDLQAQGYVHARVQLNRADGVSCQLQLTVSALPEPAGPARYRVITVTDVTTVWQQQLLLDRQTRFDALTQLPNQHEFMRRLHEGVTQADKEGFRLSVCRVDLDHFKQINERYGHAQADAVLQDVAHRLRASLRSAPQWSDTVARLSGDEFALLIRTSGPEETQLALERLLKVLSAPYWLQPAGGSQDPAQGAPLNDFDGLTALGGEPDTQGKIPLMLTASIGATVFPQDASDPETLLRHAGHALYRVKHSGRNAHQLFDTAKRLRDEASLIALARVQQALDANELRLYYQPKINMQTGAVQGVEALLRWQHPDRGLLPPLHFLPLIESTGLVLQIGDWVIEQALKQSAQWLAEGLTLNVSVNVTPRQLQLPDFSLRLLELIHRHPEPVAQHLCLEVLESAALADVDATHVLIQRCRAFGLRFALDDFGTGYSTLTYLKRLPVDELKIDRSFVRNLLVDAQDRALVDGVIGLANTFGCKVVAEGVESTAHARALLRMGCQLGQGNGIAAAMPAHEVRGWVESFAQSAWTGKMFSREQGLA
nr:EAL domain-containing protein [Roseateles koreensis]